MEEELLPSFLNTTRIFKTQIDIDDKIKELNSDLTNLEEKLLKATEDRKSAIESEDY